MDTKFIPILSQIKGKDGVYSVLGNHDYSPYIKWNTKAEQQTNLDSLLAKEARMGWQVLNNEHTIIHRGHDSIALVGVENSGNPPFPNYGDLPKALKGTDGIFKVLLSHDPTASSDSLRLNLFTPNTTDYTGKAIRLFLSM